MTKQKLKVMKTQEERDVEMGVVHNQPTDSEFNEILEDRKQTNNLTNAMVCVMNEVKNIDKAMTVGKGQNSYKGVQDKDVKFYIGRAMARHGLTCVPVNIVPSVKIERWVEETQYGKKQKQSVFTEVVATYRITHADSGESVDIMGYGHGVDSMDKSAGKATTYALKNALLYSFLVPTGSIDDTDNIHSNEAQVPRVLNQERFDGAIAAIKAGDYSKEQLQNDWDLTTEQQEVLNGI